MQNKRVRRLVGVGVIGAAAFIMLFFEIPLPFLPPFLKIDFSDVIVLLGTFIYGPLAGCLIAIIRSSLHFLFTGANLPSLIGDIAGIMASVAFILPMYYGFKRFKNWQRYLVILLAISSMTITMILANWLFVLPLYMQLMGMQLGMSMTHYLLFALLPFNLIKGILVSVVFEIVYFQVQHFVLKKQLK